MSPTRLVEEWVKTTTMFGVRHPVGAFGAIRGEGSDALDPPANQSGDESPLCKEAPHCQRRVAAMLLLSASPVLVWINETDYQLLLVAHDF